MGDIQIGDLQKAGGEIMKDTYATVEQGTTRCLARIWEAGKKPYYFVPESNECTSTYGTLIRAVNRSYPLVCFVSDATFNNLASESEVPS